MKLPKIKNRIASNATWIIGCKCVQSAFNLIISMLTARFLGPSNFGIISYAESIAAFALPVMELGFSAVLVRELVNHPDHEGEILGTSLFSCIFSGLLCMGGIAIFAVTVNHGENETVLVCVLYSLMLLAQALEMLKYWYEAHLLSKYTSVVSLIAYLLIASYKIFLLVTRKSIYWFVISNALDYFLIALFQFIIYRRLKGPSFTFSVSRFIDLFQKGKYYILSGMMIAVFSQTDRIMLKLMISNEMTGYYSAAVRCAQMTTFVFSAVINSAAPVIYASRKASQDAFESSMKKLYAVIIYSTVLQSIGFTVFAKPIIYILYGKEYSASVPALMIITWYITFSYMGIVRNRWLLAEEKQYLVWRIDLSGALANVILNLLLIPHFDVVGAAAASLLTQFFTNYVLGWIMKDIRPNNRLMMQALNPKILIDLIHSL